MTYIATNEFKGGHKVLVDKEPFLIVSCDHVKPGKGQAFSRVKLKSLISGRTLEKTFKSGDKVELADVVETKMTLSYKDGADFVFMDEKTFEQATIPAKILGDKELWLAENTPYEVIFYNNQPIEVVLPNFIETTIVETAPGDRGNTASGRVMKPARTESGGMVQVPIFINEGDKIKIDTRETPFAYISRV